MALVLPNLILCGLLAPTALPRGGPQERGGILFEDGPRLLADLSPHEPSAPARQTHQRPRACLEDESSPHGPKPEDATAPGAGALAPPAEPPPHGPEATAFFLSSLVPLIYVFCTLLV
jgi:hypothetical protein